MEFKPYITLALNKTSSLNLKLKNIDIKDYQQFVTQVFVGLDELKALMLYHGTGSGKTITTINIINYLYGFYHKWNIIILAKKSLIENPWKTSCEKYINDFFSDIQFINYDDPTFSIKFHNSLAKLNVKNRLLVIIDESHNFISRCVKKGDVDRKNKQIYNYLVNKIHNSREKNKLLCLSATPILNSVDEFKLLINLLRPNILPEEDLFNKGFLKNRNELISKLGLMTSYINPRNVELFENVEKTDDYPAKNVIIDKLTMTSHQEELYNKAEKYEKKNPSTFKVYRKLISTFAFKDLYTRDKRSDEDYNKLINNIITSFCEEINNCKMSENTLEGLKRGEDISEIGTDEELRVYNLLNSYSVKFTFLCIYIIKSKGKILVYEPFVKTFGVNILKKYFEIFNISYFEYTSESSRDRGSNLDKFNKEENNNGDKIKACIFSASAAEGITFFCINELFLLDIPWNESTLRQIIGRSIRVGSHKDTDRKYVNIHFVIIRLPNKLSVDEEMLSIIQEKSKAISQIELLLKNVSIEFIWNLESEFTYNNDSGLKNLLTRKIEFKELEQIKVNKVVRNIYVNFGKNISNPKIFIMDEKNNVYLQSGEYVFTIPQDCPMKIWNNKVIYIVENYNIKH